MLLFLCRCFLQRLPLLMSDQWIRRDATIDAETQEVSDKALDMLRKSCLSAVTYKVDGYRHTVLGSTVEIEMTDFALTVLEMRVSKGLSTQVQVRIKRFANFKALENQLSSGIPTTAKRNVGRSKTL